MVKKSIEEFKFVSLSVVLGLMFVFLISFLVHGGDSTGNIIDIFVSWVLASLIFWMVFMGFKIILLEVKNL